jgi:hypothetical protein
MESRIVLPPRCGVAGSYDQRAVEARADVLAYDSPRLASERRRGQTFRLAAPSGPQYLARRYTKAIPELSCKMTKTGYPEIQQNARYICRWIGLFQSYLHRIEAQVSKRFARCHVVVALKGKL